MSSSATVHEQRLLPCLGSLVTVQGSRQGRPNVNVTLGQAACHCLSALQRTMSSC